MISRPETRPLLSLTPSRGKGAGASSNMKLWPPGWGQGHGDPDALCAQAAEARVGRPLGYLDTWVLHLAGLLTLHGTSG